MQHADEARLVTAARAAMAHSYSPYSHYPVGAALLTASGEIWTGTNVENASYPLGICAERAAVASAVSAGQRDFVAVAVATASAPAASPCGACRQVLNEFNPGMAVLVAGPDGPARHYRLSDLLPHAFGPELLGHE
jgi:cytidine deaminase